MMLPAVSLSVNGCAASSRAQVPWNSLPAVNTHASPEPLVLATGLYPLLLYCTYSTTTLAAFTRTSSTSTCGLSSCERKKRLNSLLHSHITRTPSIEIFTPPVSSAVAGIASSAARYTNCAGGGNAPAGASVHNLEVSAIKLWGAERELSRR